MPDSFIQWFRHTSPYIHAHRDKTLVLFFSGRAAADHQFHDLIHDIALLHGLGMRVILVHGSRLQIEEQTRLHKASMKYFNGLRITDEIALESVKEAAGKLRVEIEALFSTATSNTAMSRTQITVVSGNYVTAQPIGIRDGCDYQFTGSVRKINTHAITAQLDQRNIVIVPPLGYSLTGEVFNLRALEVARSIASEMAADKLILLSENEPVTTDSKTLTHLTPDAVDDLLVENQDIPSQQKKLLNTAVQACRQGVKRTHLISRTIEGALLKELFTRDGIGTLISDEAWNEIRKAHIDDISGILSLIEPLEESGVLVRRSRETLETEIDHFYVIEREGTVLACAALYPYPEDKMAEISCVVVHTDYRGNHFGDVLLQTLEDQAQHQNISTIFVLTVVSAQWFKERRFTKASVDSLPMEKQSLYNYQRNSLVLVKSLD